MTSRVSLAGATGVVGRRVVELAAQRGSAVDVWDPRTGHEPLPGVPVLAAVPETALAEVLERCLSAGAGVIAACGDARTAASLRDRFDDVARQVGVSVVLTAGWDPLVVDLLAARASHDLPTPIEAHAAYATPRSGLSDRSPGERQRFAAALGEPFPVLDAGSLREEREAEARRLAWFPRPVGPRHAAGTSSAAVTTLPRHLPSLQTVRGYRATSTAAAEARQMLSNAARWAPAGTVLRSMLTRDRVDAAERTWGLAWACVVELTDGARVSRAWAHGEDHVSLTASALLMVADGLQERSRAPGVLAPSEVVDPGTSLDDLAARSHLRWGRAASDHQGG